MTPEQAATVLKWSGPLFIGFMALIESHSARRKHGIYQIRPSEIPAFLRIYWPILRSSLKGSSWVVCGYITLVWWASELHTVKALLGIIASAVTMMSVMHVQMAAMNVVGACAVGWLYRPSNHAPVAFLHRAAPYMVGAVSFQRVLLPVLSDLEVEYCDALSTGSTLRARWIQIRGYGCFFQALLLQLPICWSQAISKLLRLRS